ncbi:MAG: hypothetical protein CMI09_12235 [Oceanospirillaceae bacterium]|nr:hypothetical protein [Oceanospirillaceae bacterium]|tara:strand:+ start:228 stop:416 length:189 start_codon:yes stop_codon:yes gene_type:complete
MLEAEKWADVGPFETSKYVFEDAFDSKHEGGKSADIGAFDFDSIQVLVTQEESKANSNSLLM